MLGVIVNTAAVLVGSLLGLLLKKGLPKGITKAVMTGIGLCTIYIGVSGSLKGENVLILILSVVVGSVIGHLLKLDDHINNLGSKIEKKFSKGEEKSTVAEGFVTASLLFCCGAMTIVGSLQSGLTGDNTMIFTKSMLDLISSIIFAATLGIGVLFSGGFVLVFQGAIVLLARFVAPFLETNVINEMTCVGSVLIIGLALNILGVTKIKIMNYLPAIFIPIVLCLFM